MRALNTKTGEKFNEVDLKRVVASLESEETGFITCQAGHKCKYKEMILLRNFYKQHFFDRHGCF